MRRSSTGVWAIECAALSVPFTAILHHAVFFRPTCMLRPFGPEYTPSVIGNWLSRDPSLPLALLTSALIFLAGVRLRSSTVRAWVPAFLIAFAPLSLWIWDLPFAGRPICACCHDGRWLLPGIGSVRSKHLYALGMLLFAGLMLARWVRARVQVHSAAREA